LLRAFACIPANAHSEIADSLRLSLLCAQPRQVHRNAVTDVVENVTFVHCPPERRILVNVPVRVRRQRRGHKLPVRHVVWHADHAFVRCADYAAGAAACASLQGHACMH